MGLGDLLVGSNGQSQSAQDSEYAALQAKFQAALLARENAGTIDASQVADYSANTTGAAGQLGDQNAAADQGFAEGAVEIFTNPSQFWIDVGGSGITGAIKNYMQAAAATLQWEIWIAVGIAAFVMLGGWVILKKLFAR